MSNFIQLYFNQIVVTTLVFGRVGGLVLTAPIFGTKDVPLPVRALFAVALSALVAPLYWTGATLHCSGPAGWLLLFASEALIGAVLGMGVAILLTAAVMAGAVVSQVSGLSFSDVVNPGLGEEIPVPAQLLYYVTLAVFVALGGHRLVVGALLETFQSLPPGTASMPATLHETAVTLVSQSFQLSLRAAAPALTSLLLATIILGLVGRAVPQLNILALGFGVSAITMLLVLSVSIGAIAYLLSDQLAPTLDLIRQTFEARAP